MQKISGYRVWLKIISARLIDDLLNMNEVVQPERRRINYIMLRIYLLCFCISSEINVLIFEF
jgi:hypothetical protein